MKNLLLIQLLLISLTMVSCRSRTPREYFNRHKINECITLIQDGATLGQMVCNGKIMDIPSNLTIIKDQENVEKTRDYFEAREYGHYICVKYPRKCQR